LQFLPDYNEMAAAAAEAGFEAVDLTVRPAGHVLPENVIRDLPRAVEAVKKAGLETLMITTAVTGADEPYTENILHSAAESGIKYYRLGYITYDEKLGIARSLPVIQKQLATLAKMNQKFGLHGAYQNHSGLRVGGPVWDLWELLKDLDPRWIGVQYDVRHATVEGGMSWPLGMKLLAPWIKITAIKDFHWAQEKDKWVIKDVPLSQGMVDFETYFQLVQELKIDGPVSMHFEYPMTPQPENTMSKAEAQKAVVQSMKKDIAVLRGWLKQYKIIAD
jgi:L-ribulose-5-phosphate 3-epimerase